jgi:DNA-binding XRE family transcriptional regulator
MEDNSGYLNASILTTPQWSRARALNILPYMPTLRPERNIELGRRLVLSRRAVGMSQKEFAETADIPATTYNQYEKGASYPPVEAAAKLVEKHGLTLDWIYLGNKRTLQSWLADAIKALEAADAARQPGIKVVQPRRRRAS